MKDSYKMPMKERPTPLAEHGQVYREGIVGERPECASDERIDAVLSITRELFSDPIKVVQEQDPEIENESYLVFHVSASGSPREIISRQREWHRRVITCTGDAARRYRISLDVVE